MPNLPRIQRKRARDVAGATGPRRMVDAGRLGRAASHAPAGYAHIEELVGGGALAAAATAGTGGAGGTIGAASGEAPAETPAAARAGHGHSCTVEWRPRRPGR